MLQPKRFRPVTETPQVCFAQGLRGVRRALGLGLLAGVATVSGVWLAACTSGAGGGEDGGASDGAPLDSGQDSATDAGHDASTDGSNDALAADGSIQDGGSGDADSGAGSADGGGDGAATGDAGAASCAVIDVQPEGGARCGNGWRDPGEECDIGDAAAPADAAPTVRAGCSSACQVIDLLDEVELGDAGLSNGPRTLGGGRHPLAASDTTFAVATLETPSSPPTISLTTFTRKGVATGVVTPISAGSIVTDRGDPVIAALACDQYVAAWNDLNGDGDGLGVALRLVNPQVVPTGAPAFANVTTSFDQFSPDILWTGSELVVAWTDTSNATTGPDVILRTFDGALNATSGEQTLAATADAEGDVTLAEFEGSWAAAWRDDANGFEQIRVHTGSTDWTVGPAFLPPSVTTKLALVEIDAQHLLVGYSVGVDPGDTGVPNASSQLQAAIVSLGSPGAVSGSPVPVSATVEGAASALAHAYANAVRVGSLLYGAWWTAGVEGDANGEQIWFAPVAASDGGLVPAGAELLVPREAAHRVGDQRGPALAVNNLGASGALVAAWDDLGKGFGSGEENGDVVVEVIPVPVVRNGVQ